MSPESQGTAPKGAGGGHTAGPWVVKNGGKYVLVEGADGTGLFYETDRHPGALADANLIAAAPELLAVVRYAVDNPEFDSAEFDRMARAALAKAGGES